MSNKRLEIYVGWTCNQKCTYCVEQSTMQEMWDVKVTKHEILKKLLKYKKLGYNHVTYLGGEPFIQNVFKDALLLGKKLGYTILVTTNCSTLHLEKEAEKYLPFIDELFISVEAIEKEHQMQISRTNNFVKWDQVFENINKYWRGTLLKANIVINQDNKNNLFSLVDFLNNKDVKEIAITYPDLDIIDYGKEYTIERVAPKYSESVASLIKIMGFCDLNNINLKIVDFPFCVFPKNSIDELYKKTDDYDYQSRLKVSHNQKELMRGDSKLVRDRTHILKCRECRYINKCGGPGTDYVQIYGDQEINPIK